MKENEYPIRENYIEEYSIEEYPDISSTASATDTTGMMQTVPRSAEEYEAYQELSGLEVPDVLDPLNRIEFESPSPKR